MLAAKLIERAEIELHPMRALLEPATRLAIDLDHHAHDCIYLALALKNGWRIVTADARLIAKARQAAPNLDGTILRWRRRWGQRRTTTAIGSVEPTRQSGRSAFGGDDPLPAQA